MDYSTLKKVIFQHRFLSTNSTMYDASTHAPVGYVPIAAFHRLREYSIYTDASSQQEFVHVRKRQEAGPPSIYDVYGGNSGPLIAMIRLTTYRPGRYLAHGRIDLFDAQGAPMGYIQDTTSGFNKVIRLVRNIFTVGPILYAICIPLLSLTFDVVYAPTGAAPQSAGKISYRRSFLKPKLTLDMTAAQVALNPQVALGASSLLNLLVTTAVA